MNIKDIKAIVTDIDGVLTDGRIFYLNDELYRFFNIKDGVAFRLLQLAGIKTALISGKTSVNTKKRFEELGVDYYFEGVKDKRAIMETIIAETDLEWSEFCYIGDDLPDMPVIKRVGFPVAPADACKEIKDTAKYITEKNGGKGVFRETAEMILKEKGIWETILQKFFSL